MTTSQTLAAQSNPHLSPWETPHGIAPFANTLIAFDRSARQYAYIKSLRYNVSASEFSRELGAVERNARIIESSL